jgi:Ca2+-binding RTX toxin-like protein
MNDQASIVMTQEDYEDLTANPDRYELYFIDGEAVLFRDGLVFALEHKPDIPTPDVFVEVPLAVACEVLKQLDKVFFAVNMRNEALQQIEDFMTENGYWNIVDDEIEIRPSYNTNNIIYNCASGNDTYKIQKGKGYAFIHDSCPNNSGDADKIVFDYDTSDTNFILYRDSDDLYIYDVGNQSMVFAENYFGECWLEYIQFSPDITLGYKDVIKMVNKVKGTPEDDELTGYRESTVIWGEEGNDTITAEYGDEYYIHAGSGDNNITVSNGNDIIVSEDGNDYITITREWYRLFTSENPGYNVVLSGKGDDTITLDGSNIVDAGEGNDIINCGFGDDVIIYHYGDGDDKISDSINAFSNGGTDVIYFADLTPDDVYVRRDSGFTFYVKGDKKGSVNIPGTYQNGASKFKEPIEYVMFKDGTVWNLYDYLDKSRTIVDTEKFTGKDTLGYYITGTDNDDTYYTGGGNDVIIPGKGNDYVNAGGGTDTFVFYRGDGHDIFDESNGGSYPPGGEDTVLFKDIRSDEVRIGQYGSTITIKVNGSSDAVELPGIYESGASGRRHPIEKAKFADGVEWTFLEMLEMSMTEATDGDDDFDTFSTINGLTRCGKGNDHIRGKEATDTYVYELGDGHDVIEDYSVWWDSYDIIRFGNGITPDMFCLKNDGNTYILSIPNTEDSLTLTKGQIETFTFTDGSSLEENELIAKAADHHYSETPECVWTNNEGNYSAKFVFVCSDCGAKVSYAAEVECEEGDDGVKVYNAKATVAGKEHTAVYKKTPVAYKAPEISYEAGANSVKLSWTKVDAADMYGLYGYVSGKWQLISESKDTSFVINSLKAGTEYKVAVVSKIDGKWNKDTSNAVTVKTLDQAQSRYPSVTSTQYNDKYHQFRLNWTKVNGTSQYGVAVKIAGKWKVYAYTDANTTTFTSPKLKAGSTYEMVICAKVNGKWDTSNLNARAFKVTVK